MHTEILNKMFISDIMFIKTWSTIDNTQNHSLGLLSLFCLKTSNVCLYIVQSLFFIKGDIF